MSTQIRITVDGCNPGSGSQPGSGSPPATGGQPLPGALQVSQPLSSQPQSVTDGAGNDSGLQLATTDAPVYVTTGLAVDGTATLSGGAAVTEGLSADTVTINSQAMPQPPAFAASVTGGLSADTATVDKDATIAGAATLSGGAAVTGGLSADTVTINSQAMSPPPAYAATVTGGLSADSLTVATVMQTFTWLDITGFLNPLAKGVTVGPYISEDVTALTDGFVLAVVGQSDTVTIGPSQVSTILQAPTVTASAGCILYPVNKGATFKFTSMLDVSLFNFWGIGNAGVG